MTAPEPDKSPQRKADDCAAPDQLRLLQEWMQTVITHRDGVAAGIDSPTAKSLFDVSPADVARIIEPSSQLDSIDRLAVYGNAYYARLLECLRDEFPSLCKAIGESAFDGLAFGYLQQHPSRSYTLAELGARFPAYLSESRPDDGEPRPNWTDFLIELAELERTYAEVFDGPGPEKNPVLDSVKIQQMDQATWGQARLVIVPWLRLKSFQYPVHEFASAVRVHGELPAAPAPTPTYLAVTRREYVVRRVPLNAAQFELLSALAGRAAIVDAIASAAERFEGELSEFGAAIRRWFFDWTAAGFFAEIQTSD